MKVYAYGKQSISQDDIDAVLGVLKSDFLTQGPELRRFEDAICEYTGSKYCVAVSSATAALHLSMMALGVGQGDEVITTPNTFVASANCVRYVGGDVKFADIDPKTANISAEEIEKSITERTRAIIPVHFAGQSCDMEAIHRIAAEKGIFIVEDAAHAIGSDYKNTKVGSCKYSDITVFSFHPVKTIATGEGGALTTNDKDLYEKLLLFRGHGIVRSQEIAEKHGLWYYEMRDLGFNYRMTELQAALGVSQLKKLDQIKEKRRHIVSLYRDLLCDLRIGFLEERNYSNACFHLCPVLIDFEKLGINKIKFVRDLFKAGIHSQIHYIPVHLHPYYRNLGLAEGDYPEVERYYSKTISLPLYYDLSDDDIHCIVNKFREIM